MIACEWGFKASSLRARHRAAASGAGFDFASLRSLSGVRCRCDSANQYAGVRDAVQEGTSVLRIGGTRGTADRERLLCRCRDSASARASGYHGGAKRGRAARKIVSLLVAARCGTVVEARSMQQGPWLSHKISLVGKCGDALSPALFLVRWGVTVQPQCSARKGQGG